VNADTGFMINNEPSDRSPTCFALRTMIEKGWLLLAPTELEEYLGKLQKQGFITGMEHKSLFALAMGKKRSDKQAKQ
jgi:hypothetical protein